MAVKVFFLLCVEAVFAQTACSQYLGGGFPGPNGLGWGYDGLPYDGMGLAPYDGFGVGALDNYGYNPFDSSSCYNWHAGFNEPGSFGASPIFSGPVYSGGPYQSSGSSIPLASISVISDNFIDGTVSVLGQLPFISSVSMSGEFPSAGSGSVSYGCGDCSIRIVGEGPFAPSFMPAAPIIETVDYNSLYSYGPSFIDDYRGSIPYTGCCYSPVY